MHINVVITARWQNESGAFARVQLPLGGAAEEAWHFATSIYSFVSCTTLKVKAAQ